MCSKETMDPASLGTLIGLGFLVGFLLAYLYCRQTQKHMFAQMDEVMFLYW